MPANWSSATATRKLIWRLPGIDALSREDQLRAYTDVGGHPRALEYLDALLRGGEARFRDISERKQAERTLKAKADELARSNAELETLVDSLHEQRGLDFTEHYEIGYPEFQKDLTHGGKS